MRLARFLPMAAILLGALTLSTSVTEAVTTPCERTAMRGK